MDAVQYAFDCRELDALAISLEYAKQHTFEIDMLMDKALYVGYNDALHILIPYCTDLFFITLSAMSTGKPSLIEMYGDRMNQEDLQDLIPIASARCPAAIPFIQSFIR